MFLVFSTVSITTDSKILINMINFKAITRRQKIHLILLFQSTGFLFSFVVILTICSRCKRFIFASCNKFSNFALNFTNFFFTVVIVFCFCCWHFYFLLQLSSFSTIIQHYFRSLPKMCVTMRALVVNSLCAFDLVIS